MEEKVKTKFPGPGAWRSQAARLESEVPDPEESTPKKDNPVKKAFKKVKE